MEISFLGGVGFKIKTKTATAIVGKTPGEITVEGSDFVIAGSGEYEVGGVSVVGIVGQKAPMYVIELEGLRIAYLGGTDGKLADEQLSELGAIDIAMVTTAAQVKQVDPWVAIPMGDSMEAVIKELGAESVVPVPKFSITVEKLPSELQVVVLEKK